ncbi:MAG: hypothetical protein ABI992_04855 [Chthoniobacterales bacterium]
MKPIALVLALAMTLSGCSFSKEGRQKHAYEKYVRKSSTARQKQRSKFHNGHPQMPVSPMPSEPVRSTSSGPEAATSGDAH